MHSEHISIIGATINDDKSMLAFVSEAVKESMLSRPAFFKVKILMKYICRFRRVRVYNSSGRVAHYWN